MSDHSFDHPSARTPIVSAGPAGGGVDSSGGETTTGSRAGHLYVAKKARRVKRTNSETSGEKADDELVCNAEHDITDASSPGTEPRPMHSPSLTSSHSGDAASSEVRFILCNPLP